MTPLAALFRSSLWWLVPAAILAAAIGWETDFGRGVRKVAPAPAPVAAKPVPTSLLPEYTIPGGPAAHRETVERALFTPTRRPAPAATVAEAKARMQRGQFALTGTMMVDGRNTAFLREVSGGRSRRVSQGDTLNGMLVSEVKPDRVKLALGDEVEELVLRVSTNPRPTPPGPAVAAPVPGIVPMPSPVAAAVPPPPAAQPPVPPGAASDAAAAQAQSLLERRRAARAAAQQQAVNPAAAPSANGLPPAAGDMGAPNPVVPGPQSTVTPSDPGWNAVYQRYQYRTTP